MWVDSWYPPACASGGREPPDSGPATFGTHAEIELVPPVAPGLLESARGPVRASGRDGRGQHPQRASSGARRDELGRQQGG